MGLPGPNVGSRGGLSCCTTEFPTVRGGDPLVRFEMKSDSEAVRLTLELSAPRGRRRGVFPLNEKLHESVAKSYLCGLFEIKRHCVRIVLANEV